MKTEGRWKKAYFNTFASLLLELVTIACGLILPRLILRSFGSVYNGVVSSITQFISCVTLLRSGLGGVTRAALYKPLSQGDRVSVSSIVRATEGFMRRVSRIYVGLLVMFAAVYPFIVSEFDWVFTFTLVLILGISKFFECRFGIAYQFLLQADQRRYIVEIIRCICLILNTVVAALLIKAGGSIHIVKLGSAFVFILEPFLIYIYAKKRYKLDKKAKEDERTLNQRWEAFAHQVAAFVTTNTDIMVLTVFCDIRLVSVYSVHNMITAPMKNLITSLANGAEAAFGDMLARCEGERLTEKFRVYEYTVFTVSALLFTCTAILIASFVSIYTGGITDTDYYRPLFGCLMAAAQFAVGIRLPYQTLVETSGRFRETRNGAIAEAAINIIISVVLVKLLGLIGVAIGTITAVLFRTVQYALYVDKHMIKGCFASFLKNLAVNLVFSAVMYVIIACLPRFITTSYMQWAVYAAAVFITGCVLMAAFGFVFSRRVFMELIRASFSIFRGRKRR
ncbi:MAG: sugar isomerase [Christensenellaceae bacterium]|nr:sugar isomerase [Christensenellaceae bacterium]